MPTATKKNLFRPDCKTKFATTFGMRNDYPTESISKTGGCIVVTPYNDEEGYCAGYLLTHTLTGAAMCGSSVDIPALKTKARRFWAALDKQQKRVYQTSSDPATVRAATPAEAITLLRY